MRTAWKADRHAEGWRKAYEAMRARYELVLPVPPATDAHEVAGTAAADPP